MDREEQLRKEIIEVSHTLHRRGWVANHDGNLSARLDGGRILATPTAVSKGDVRPEWLIVVDGTGKRLSGTRKSFSEIALHLAAYAARPDIGVVLHAHPPTITGFAVAGIDLGHPFMAEPVVTLGPCIPVLAYQRPKSPGWTDGLAAALQQADVVILERHGLLSVGGSFEQALLRMELVEHLAQISLAAHQLGGVRPLPAEDVQALSAKGRPPSVPDFSGQASGIAAPAPSRAGATQSAPDRQASASGRPNVRSLVDDALRRYR